MEKSLLGVQRFIGNKIHEARIAAGLTRNELRQKIGVTETQLMKYENGTNQVSIEKLMWIAEALSLDLSYFFNDIKPVRWDEKTSNNHRASLNISNNFMKIEDPACKKAISALLSALAKMSLKQGTNIF